MFGTDGVRGLANVDIITNLTSQLGGAAARQLDGSLHADRSKPRMIAGRDTRISGEFFDHTLAAGLASTDMDVTRIGAVTTPTIAHPMATENTVDLDIMISASHNPMSDSSIKSFAHGSYKLADSMEDQIEALVNTERGYPTGDAVSEINADHVWAKDSYIAYSVGAVGTDLCGMKTAIDCTNGMASELGPAASHEPGTDITATNASLNGYDIDLNVGSTYPESLQATAAEADCDFGVVHDGDVDRCLVVDREDNLIDGDKTTGSLTVNALEHDTLTKDTLVATAMSNLGLLIAMCEADIKAMQAGMDDHYMLEGMLVSGCSSDDKQPGHIIARDHATTSNGVLSSLLTSRMVKESGRSLADLTSFIQRLPQTLINVGDVGHADASASEAVAEAVAVIKARLGKTGRVLLRPSGTEPFVCIMVEATMQEEADSAAASLADVVRKSLVL